MNRSVNRRTAYIQRPPWARIADRLLRSGFFLSLAGYSALHLFDPHTPFMGHLTAGKWYVEIVMLALVAASLVGAYAVSTGRPQAELIVHPIVMGCCGALSIVGLGVVGINPRSLMILAVVFICAARVVWLWSLRAEVREAKGV